MKKWIMILAASVLALVLSACGQTATPKEDSETGKEDKVIEKSDLTIEEVMEKANAASETMQSMHADMEITQNMQMGEEEQVVNSTIDMDMILEPLAMRQTMNMEMAGEEMAMDLYMTQDGFFMKDPESGDWMKLPNEMYEEVAGQVAGSANTQVDYSLYEQFADDFKFEQTDDEYVLRLKGSGEKFSGLMKDLMKENMPAGMDEAQLDMISQMEIESIDLEFTIDKKTFYTKNLDMDMVLTMEEQGQQVKVAQKIKGDISKINEIDEIKVPKEVIDGAVDINEAMEQQQ
ncbi:DUF6612 family protein [Sporosarcina aquimarina]|uniref:DUF6612 family protein n=1 Tax=Sporosarcina aquimarina TaxID=114975 RepID=UPI001C8D348B|nr:DUF6612 family protein [Sporosarcina aquimarina]MBY0222232.1 hypothetical protein [Sporosarcina aquimarina]